MLNGIAGRRAARGDAQLTVDGAEVRMNGAGAEHQLFSYLGVGEAFGYQAQHPTSRAVSPSG
jgi:hypothetical protein